MTKYLKYILISIFIMFGMIGRVEAEITCDNAKQQISSIEESPIYEICLYKEDNTESNYFVIATMKDRFAFYEYSNGFKRTSNFVEIKYTDFYTCRAIDTIYYATPFSISMPDAGTSTPAQSSFTYKKALLTTEEQYSNLCMEIYEEAPFELKNIEVKKCEDLLSPEIREEVNSILLYIKIGVPIIIIVLGILDFGKAVIASDEDAMKKAQKKFFMRLIIGMVIFFIPTFVNILLDIANTVWGFSDGTCGITY